MPETLPFWFSAWILVLVLSMFGAAFNGLALYFILGACRSPKARHLWQGAFMGWGRAPDYLTTQQRFFFRAQKILVVLILVGFVPLIAGMLLVAFSQSRSR